jgi:hypothetical protein
MSRTDAWLHDFLRWTGGDMNTFYAQSARPALAVLCVAACVALGSCGGSFCVGLNGCTGTVVPPNVTLAGTAATGKALASAAVSVNCSQGAGSTLSDGGGNYSITLSATLPCVLTVVSGSTTLHSVAFAGGTFNVTPQTDLLLVYLAAQLNTTEAGLLAGFQSNFAFAQVLASQSDVLAAQAAVVANLQQRYALTLTVPTFLTTRFIVGQAGVDSDLEALAAAGAIDANGMPNAAAVSLMAAAGAAHPLATSSPAPMPSSGGSGSTSGVSGGMM